jgi:hypothetical protein
MGTYLFVTLTALLTSLDEILFRSGDNRLVGPSPTTAEIRSKIAHLRTVHCSAALVFAVALFGVGCVHVTIGGTISEQQQAIHSPDVYVVSNNYLRTFFVVVAQVVGIIDVRFFLWPRSILRTKPGQSDSAPRDSVKAPSVVRSPTATVVPINPRPPQ